MENINGVKQITEDTIISLEVEELESRIAPATVDGRIMANHNETMLEDMAEVEELESRVAPATAVPTTGDGKIVNNHNETMLRDGA